MWHEARRHEKLVRSKMVDNAKRHERRKVFYESIRRDPEEFMQIHGRRATIHMDASVAAAAEASSILRKWQGDPTVLIDRFDVRAHLDHIPEPTSGGGCSDAGSGAKQQLLLDDAQELQCEYERYRILIFNEYLKVSERSCLQQIAATEFWPSGTSNNVHKQQQETKKRAAEKKAAIGFTYADSTAQSSSATSNGGVTNNFTTAESDNDSSDDMEIDEIDMKFDVDEITPEQGAQLNKIGARYRIGGGVFLKLLRLDHTEQENNAQIKEIDKAKLALSGRQAKADRAALKRRRATIVGKVTQSEEATTTLLSFVAKRNVDESLRPSSSDSDSDDVEKTEFITSFGGASDEEEEDNGNGQRMGTAGASSSHTADNENVVQGPVLPTKEYRRLLELKRRRSNSAEDFRDPFESMKRRRSRSRSADRYGRRVERPTRRRRSPSRSVNGHNNRNGRFSHYSRSSRRSRSRSREERRGGCHNRDDNRRRSSASSSRSSSVGLPVAASAARRDSSAPSNGSVSGSDSPLTIRSSVSESEKEQLEIENRKRRIRRIKRGARPVERSSAAQPTTGGEEVERHKARLAKKLRHQMQKALKKTAEQLKQGEEEKAREQYKERKQREEELLEEARILRMREREKLRIEDEKEAARRERDRLERRDADRRRRDRDSGSSRERSSHRRRRTPS